MKRIVVIGLALMVPLAAVAATFADIFGRVRSVMNLVIPLLASVAFAASLYGIIRFIASANSEEKRSEAKKYILYGLIGMFVIVAFWGILTIVANTFFGDSLGSPISIPEINLPNPSPSPSPTPTPTPSPTPNPNPFPIPPPTPTPNPNPTPCTPKTYQELCQQIKAQCGIHEITDDNCGNSISISCGFCDYPQVCSASGQCGGGVAPIPPLTNGIVLDWNVNHVVEQFAPNETKTFIIRVPQNANGFQVSFQTMGIMVTGSFRIPLKPDGTHYKLTLSALSSVVEDSNGTLISGLSASNEGAVDFKVFTRSFVLDPYIYPGDFILTLTTDVQGGWGWIATSIYY
jgi:hypothetical protein